MKCKQRINKFIRTYNNTIEEQTKNLIKLKDKKRLIRLENELETSILEYKELYKKIKDYIVPYVEFMQKYEKKLSLAQEVNSYINRIDKI